MPFSEKNLKNIMSCDGYICIDSDKHSIKEINNDIDQVENTLRAFEETYSRFLNNNELDRFNSSSGEIKISEELFDILNTSQKFYKRTNGVFDIAILPDLLSEGYVVSKDKGFVGKKYKKIPNRALLIGLELNITNLTANKPADMKIDLGGIGKGYAIDKVAKVLGKKYTNFCVELGGDMYVAGVDTQNKYKYWAIEVENPFDESAGIETLIVKDKGIATSGTNRRKWLLDGKAKNHLIDVSTGESLDNGLVSTTVIADTSIEADVLAKSVMIMGLKFGLEFCEKEKIAAMFVDNNLNRFFSSKIKPYVWK